MPRSVMPPCRRHRLACVAAAVTGLTGCSPSSEPATRHQPTDAEVDAGARAYFAELSADSTVLHRRDALQGDAAMAFAWLERVLARPNVASFGYHLARVDGNSPAYALARATAKGKLSPVAGKAYVTLRYVPDGLACPEYHGVVDPEGPTLLAFWGEGG